MPFTINQINEASSKVKSGADFPAYVQDIIKLGVKSYETYVSDGHTTYKGAEDFLLQSEGKYPALEVSTSNKGERFKQYLQMHQGGQTDFPTFCRHAAETGVEKWRVDTLGMTCTYFSKAGEKMLEEKIPTPV